MLVVSFSDFSQNLEKYMAEAEKRGIKIERDGKPPLRIAPYRKSVIKKLNALKAAVGVFPSDIDFDKIKTERILSK